MAGSEIPILPSCPIELLFRDVPIRADRTGHTVERTIDEFGEQQTAIVDRAGHDRPSLGDGLESDAAIIGFVTDQKALTRGRRSLPWATCALAKSGSTAASASV